jgi:hypothetical protein
MSSTIYPPAFNSFISSSVRSYSPPSSY